MYRSVWKCSRRQIWPSEMTVMMPTLSGRSGRIFLSRGTVGIVCTLDVTVWALSRLGLAWRWGGAVLISEVKTRSESGERDGSGSEEGGWGAGESDGLVGSSVEAVD